VVQNIHLLKFDEIKSLYILLEFSAAILLQSGTKKRNNWSGGNRQWFSR